MKAIIIGAGVGGLASGIRLAKNGWDVHIFEANAFPGGKVNSKMIGDFRFDMGPSVFTEPQLIDEILKDCGIDNIPFSYHSLEESCRYFFEDGQYFRLPSGRNASVETLSKALNENKEVVADYLETMEKNYKAVYPVFIAVSLHRFSHWFNKHVWKAIRRIFAYGLSTSMHKMNASRFSNPKTVQIFDRLATYNGSSPYKTPGMLNIISHLEMNEGPAMPKGGMVAISDTLYEVALQIGVTFHFNEKVEEIKVHQNRVEGVRTQLESYTADVVVSNMDVHFTYEKLLKNVGAPKRNLKQEKSSSAVVFYWGINRSFDELGVHNIFFAKDYKHEFECIFENKVLTDDPTIYVHISSKAEHSDAPEGKENWFVMVNAPINVGQDWDTEIARLRKHIIEKLSQQLKIDIASLIEVEEINEPRKIEAVYAGKQGSIYGNSSNSAFAAFLRHPNFSKSIKGLYFAGVTVHPGGGIPLALNSAKIVERCVEEDFS